MIDNKLLHDPEFRLSLRENPALCLQKWGASKEIDNLGLLVKTNTRDIFYFIIPVLDHSLSEDSLREVSAASRSLLDTTGVSTVGSVGSLSSASTIGTVTTCTGCASTAGSASSVGSMGSVH